MSPMKFLPRCLLLVGFALLAFSGKLWLLDRAGTDLPAWDQWDGESASALQPWVTHQLTAAKLVEGHNEHRIALTRLFAIGLFEVNDRQWDALVEATASCVVHVIFAVVLLVIARRFIRDPVWLGLCAALLIALVGLPVTPENTLSGFQVQFYFLLLFSVLHLWLTLECETFGWRWGLGQVSAVLTLGTMASGFLSSAAVLGVLGWRLMRERHWSRLQCASAAVALAVIGIGWFTRHVVPGNDHMHATHLSQVLAGTWKLLLWPGFSRHYWRATLLLLPLAVFVLRRAWKRPMTPADTVAFGLLAWTLLQCVAIAYGRGGEIPDAVYSNRYLDLLAPKLALGVIALGVAFPRWARWTIGVLWLAVLGFYLQQGAGFYWKDSVAPNIARDQRRIAHVHTYLRTGNAHELLDQAPGEIPYPTGSDLILRLNPKVVRDYLPASVRLPVKLSSSPGAGRAIPPLLPPAPETVAVSTWAGDSPDPRSSVHWRSRPVTIATRPVLRFYVAGNLGDPARKLRLVIHGANGTEDIAPAAAPGDAWAAVEIFRPSGAWWLEAVDEDPQGWFAVTEPVEVGRASWFVRRLVHSWLAVAIAGGLAALAGGVLVARRHENVA
jgi:hypothetical protein